MCCDLLKNSYLCLLNNTLPADITITSTVVICWKIRIFAYWTTPSTSSKARPFRLWFAEKFVSLLIEQHREDDMHLFFYSCDLLKNSYLCLLNNTYSRKSWHSFSVVICWKIRIFAYWTTPRETILHYGKELWFAEKFVSLLIEQHPTQKGVQWTISCDLLKNSYLCLLNNTRRYNMIEVLGVVICWKIRIFAYWTTP